MPISASVIFLVSTLLAAGCNEAQLSPSTTVAPASPVGATVAAEPVAIAQATTLPSADQLVINAVQSGDLARAEAALRQGNVDAGNVSVGYPISIAAEQGNLAMVRLLVAQGANVNVLRPDGMTPLGKAVEAGNLELVRILMQAGASPNRYPVQGVSPLYKAVEAGNLEIVRVLLAGGAQPDTEINGTPPLYKAVEAGNVEMVRMLLEAGANPQASRQGVQVLALARQQGNTEIVRLLTR